MIAEGLLGLFVFSRRGQAYTPEPAAAKPASVPGDRTSPWFDRAATLLFIFATFKVLGLWMPWGRAHHLPAASVLLWFSYICLVILITAVLHEGGHALAAYTFRMKLLSFNAGPLQWRKREGKWRFQFRTSGVLGGNVHVLPTHPDQPAWHDICMVAAGPLVNLSTGPIFLWAAFHAQGAPWQPAWFFFALMASFSFLAAAFNLLPFRSATGSFSDGLASCNCSPTAPSSKSSAPCAASRPPPRKPPAPDRPSLSHTLSLRVRVFLSRAVILRDVQNLRIVFEQATRSHRSRRAPVRDHRERHAKRYTRHEVTVGRCFVG